MSTPRWTAEGVKVAGDGQSHHCGACGAFMLWHYGCPGEGIDCPKCGTHNRADYAPDMPSERLAELVNRLDKVDSVEAARVAEELGRLVADVFHFEECTRIMLGGSGPVHAPPASRWWAGV